MSTNVTPQEAAAALAQIEDARAAMRRIIRQRNGHQHLLIWGGAWILMPLTAHLYGNGATRYFGLICLLAFFASFVVGRLRQMQIREPLDTRFLGALAVIIGFAACWPFLWQGRPAATTIYAYVCLVVMQAYTLAGLWFDSYLLWLGLIITALILTGLFVFPAVFWLWMAGFGGGGLVLTGLYIRYFWR